MSWRRWRSFRSFTTVNLTGSATQARARKPESEAVGVTPAATAYLLTHRLPVMMALAALIAPLSGVMGLYLSYYLSIASGAAIVLTATVFFLLVFLIKRPRNN